MIPINPRSQGLEFSFVAKFTTLIMRGLTDKGEQNGRDRNPQRKQWEAPFPLDHDPVGQSWLRGWVRGGDGRDHCPAEGEVVRGEHPRELIKQKSQVRVTTYLVFPRKKYNSYNEKIASNGSPRGLKGPVTP